MFSSLLVDHLAVKFKQFNMGHGKSANLEKKLFQEIVAHNDIKKIFTKAILSTRPVHILLVGPPGSAKTMFLSGIYHHFRESLFVVASNTTKAGLIDQLFATRPKFVLVDELEKMNKSDQVSLLHLMETGIIAETKITKTRKIHLNCWVFATANSYEKIAEPLMSRFVVLDVPEYTLEEFREIVTYRLERENIDRNAAEAIAEQVWSRLRSKDVRDAIKVGRLAKDIQGVTSVVGTMESHCRKFRNEN